MRMDTSGNRTANVGKTIEGSRFRPLSTREARSLFLPSSYQVINCDRDRGHSLRLLGGKNRNVAAGERRWITTIERGGALWRCTVTRKKYYYFYYTTVVMVVAGRGESWRRIHFTIGLRAPVLLMRTVRRTQRSCCVQCTTLNQHSPGTSKCY